MGIPRRRPAYFRYKSFTPRNRAQSIRIRIPQRPDRPIKIHPRDAVVWEEAKDRSPEWLVVHRRGPLRPKVGLDYLESRAISRGLIRGSLPERILYQSLLDRHWVPGLDFTFQSSQDGGRLELGGMVVDFLFEDWRIALRVQGFSHEEFIQQKKDEEQAQILQSFGFSVLDIDVDTIYDASKLEAWFRRHLDFLSTTRIWTETFTEGI